MLILLLEYICYYFDILLWRSCEIKWHPNYVPNKCSIKKLKLKCLNGTNPNYYYWTILNNKIKIQSYFKSRYFCLFKILKCLISTLKTVEREDDCLLSLRNSYTVVSPKILFAFELSLDEISPLRISSQRKNIIFLLILYNLSTVSNNLLLLVSLNYFFLSLFCN